MRITKKLSVILVVTLAIVIGAGVFYACQKDVAPTGKEVKSLGNYPQPTQIVDIATFINVENSIYPVTGSAIVGSYDGRIYECNLTWTDVVFNAILKSELYEVMIEVDSVWENYIITINAINNAYVTSQSIEDLWGRVVAICNVVISNPISTIDYPFVLPEIMAPYEYAVYEEDFDFLSEYILLSGENFIFSNNENGLIEYGFPSETKMSELFGTNFPFNIFYSIGFDINTYAGDDVYKEDIVVIDDEGGNVECCRLIITKNTAKLWVWANHEYAAKQIVGIKKVGNIYIGISKKPKS